MIGETMKLPPFLVCNVGWMKNYRGVTENDKIIGGGEYVDNNKTGHEVCNFQPIRGTIYGYVQPVGTSVRIERLGASLQDESISDIDVVFVARDPRLKSTRVIGWYKSATVYRHMQNIPNGSIAHKTNEVSRFRFKAEEKNVVLLPELSRTLRVPREKGGMGHSNVWYPNPDDPVGGKFIKEVLTLLKGKVAVKQKPGRAHQPDPEKRKAVEDAGMSCVRAYFEDMGHEVVYVHKDNLGWDLEVFIAGERDERLLRVEVKGLSGEGMAIELTPNEYDAFKEKKLDYALCVVTNALVAPKLFAFTYNPANGKWQDRCNPRTAPLKIKERVAAAISV